LLKVFPFPEPNSTNGLPSKTELKTSKPRLPPVAPPDIDGFSEIFLPTEEKIEGKAKKSS
jgi:hypothetical protein